MVDQNEEYESRKRAIFDSMSKRGQERVLRLGYENWDPFQEPKDPREQIRGSAAARADMLVRQFYATHPSPEQAHAYHRELLELCRDLLQGAPRAQVIFEFCAWYRQLKG